MSFPPPRSLLNPYPEPLPPYTPRQPRVNEPETASIRSSAPSYVSAAPSYHSSPPPHHTRASDIGSTPDNSLPTQSNSSAPPPTSSPSRQTGLPSSQRYAPGFETRGGDLSHVNVRSLYNISEWVPVTGGLQARHYHNVAKRRVTDASRSLFPSLFSEPAHGARYENAGMPDTFQRRYTAPSLGSGGAGPSGESYNLSSLSLVNNFSPESSNHPRSHSPHNATGSSVSLDYYPGNPSSEDLTFYPLEDPDLVGEAAAARFRSQRIYRTLQQEENFYQQTQHSGSNARQHEPRHPDHVYQYSSLIAEADNLNIRQRPSTAPGLSSHEPFNTDSAGPSNPEETVDTLQRSNTVVDYDELLRAQESKTWDCMLAQMADWEERQRNWKKFKDDLDKRLNSSLKIGMGWSMWSPGGGRRKLKKEQFGSHPGLKKWKSKVGLAN
ncbi:hypothetical protein CPC735_019800 [Coccidioides posadasii C735 delta SOWgp]|uniref:Uncharacterized protein n=1 Tax=Coccidioides posadasii (strain C735) TaxID=222929 RepID=C5PJ03_COCP7|nr:hypothetical protein CPC735_019800 [Coccidioides posadasii C735 delta SOWgp]EER22952.1 hypothetical protein CPC735_019800 [Coccidioides posadasii C735 delta SOWgp]|eukprot:XP_003065097.1 hypothetical protein CPC735_019800 [Coccidioides posadasii C735 delta SOWgp]